MPDPEAWQDLLGEEGTMSGQILPAEVCLAIPSICPYVLASDHEDDRCDTHIREGGGEH
jgi:hypothetical protein